eukprot:gene4367-6179_t
MPVKLSPKAKKNESIASSFGLTSMDCMKGGFQTCANRFEEFIQIFYHGDTEQSSDLTVMSENLSKAIFFGNKHGASEVFCNLFLKHASEYWNLILHLALSNEEKSIAESFPYNGRVKWCKGLISAITKLTVRQKINGVMRNRGRHVQSPLISSAIKNDSNKNDSSDSRLLDEYSLAAYELIDIILDSNKSLQSTDESENLDSTSPVSSSAIKSSTIHQERTLLIEGLLQVFPARASNKEQAEIALKRYMTVLTRVITGINSSSSNNINNNNIPFQIKMLAKSNLLKLLSYYPPSCVKVYGYNLIQIIRLGEDYHDLIPQFARIPTLYTFNPKCVHQILSEVITWPLRSSWYILSAVSNNHPVALVPHTEAIIKLTIAETDESQADAAFRTHIASVLRCITSVSSDTIFPFLPILAKNLNSKNFQHLFIEILGYCAQQSNPDNAADQVFNYLLNIIRKNVDPSIHTLALSKIQQIKHLIKKELLQNNINFLKQSNSPNDSTIVTTIVDFLEGRSLEKFALRLNEMESKVTMLNDSVKNLGSFDEIVAYIDRNIKEVKDFLGSVVMKLPLPGRLEVVGSLRKTLILHFVCSKTGLEFPVPSKDWNKWLKVGFTLIQAGKAIIDLGIGNPFGIIKTGVDCLADVYNIYKTADDDEFNAYMTNPFLTSTEQDGLLLKLREIGFFAKFAYDNQTAGWYLLNPSEDGVEPGGQTGTVTKVKSKVGYGIKDEIKDAVKSIIPNKKEEKKSVIDNSNDKKNISQSPFAKKKSTLHGKFSTNQVQVATSSIQETSPTVKAASPVKVASPSTLKNSPRQNHNNVKSNDDNPNNTSSHVNNIASPTILSQSTTTNAVMRPLLEGFLTKQGRLVKNWKRRYFMLKDSVLSYYESENDAKSVTVKGEPYHLQGATISLLADGITIQIFKSSQWATVTDKRSADRNLLCRAENNTEAQNWVNALKIHADY